MGGKRSRCHVRYVLCGYGVVELPWSMTSRLYVLLEAVLATSRESIY